MRWDKLSGNILYGWGIIFTILNANNHAYTGMVASMLVFIVGSIILSQSKGE